MVYHTFLRNIDKRRVRDGFPFSDIAHGLNLNCMVGSKNYILPDFRLR